jgi:hypothetical protein
MSPNAGLGASLSKRRAATEIIGPGDAIVFAVGLPDVEPSPDATRA